MEINCTRFFFALVVLLKDLKVGYPPVRFRPANVVGLSLETRYVGQLIVIHIFKIFH